MLALFTVAIQCSCNAVDIIDTVAGDGTTSSVGDGNPAVNAGFNNLQAIAVDIDGSIITIEALDNSVRRFVVGGNIGPVTGTGLPGFNDNVDALLGQVQVPHHVTVDSAGNIFIADTENHRIRKIDKVSRIISTVAGSGPTGSANGGYAGENLSATSALMNQPRGIAVDSAGNLYIADSVNKRIRKVNAVDGKINTIGGDGTFNAPAADGMPATSGGIPNPECVICDAAGNLYVSCNVTNLQIVVKIDAAGNVFRIAGAGPAGYSGDNLPAVSALLDGPNGLALDGSGNLYIADGNNHAIRKVDLNTGIITTLVGDGTPGTSGENVPVSSAKLNVPTDVAVGANGTLYISDRGNAKVKRVRHILPPASLVIAPSQPVGLPGTSITFNATAVSPSNQPLTYTWTFSDGLPGGTGQSITHTFGTEGLFNVSLDVHDGFSTSTIMLSYPVYPPPTGAAITASPTLAKAGDVVTFTAAGTSPSLPVTYLWDFGDGSVPISGATVTHAFSTEAVFTVTMSVFDGYQSLNATQAITVLAPNSGGAGVVNVSVGKPPIVNPLNGISMKVSAADGGIVELEVDIDALNRAAFEAETAFDGLLGRVGMRKGTKVLQKFSASGLNVATTAALELPTMEVKGKARKTLAISAKEVGEPVKIKTVPQKSEIKMKSMKGSFLFGRAGAATLARPDSVSLKAELELPEGLDLSQEQEVWMGMGNVIDKVMVDAKGKGKTAGELLRIKKMRMKYPRLAKGESLTGVGQMAKLDITMSMNDMVSNGFDTEGISRDAKDLNEKNAAPRQIQLAMIIAGVTYEATVPVEFKVSKNLESGLISGRGK